MDELPLTSLPCALSLVAAHLVLVRPIPRKILAFAFLFSLSGCVIYLDNPPLRYISGRVLRADTLAPIPGASVWFLSGRKPFSLLPVDTFGIDASATTDADGRFSISTKLNSRVDVMVQNDELIGQFLLPPFPPSNRIDNLVWKLSEKKPLLRNAAPQKQLAAIGAKDSKGRAIGEYRIVNTLGGTQSEGRFVAGFKEGLWTFWDSRGTRTGEIHYYENVASGEFRLFYSALAYPSAAGRLKTLGHATRGHIVGEHIGYDIDGTIISRAVFSPTGAVTASVGTVKRARALAEADQRLFLGLDQSIRGALR